MDCPVCSKKMKQQDFGGIKVDVCSQGCMGIWFDWFELEKLDEKHEGSGEDLKAYLEKGRQKDNNRGTIKCPKCSIPMKAHLYKAAKEVTVDECYACGGFFLDSGELKVIRDHFMTEEQREAFVQKLLAEDKEFQGAKKDLNKERQRISALGKMTKFFRLPRP